jgi:hypothetical protein
MVDSSDGSQGEKAMKNLLELFYYEVEGRSE